MKKIFPHLLIVLILASPILVPQLVSADERTDNPLSKCAPTVRNPQTGVEEPKPTPERPRICIDNPVAGEAGATAISFTELFGRIIKFILGIVGAFALFFFILGGFSLIISGGSAEKIKKAKGTLVWAILGLAVSFGSYIILSTLIKALTTA